MRLREITVQQFQVLGLFQRLVAARGLVAVSDDIPRQRRQHVLGRRLGRNGGHSRERSHRSGYGDGRPRFARLARREGKRLAGDGAIRFSIARQRLAVSRQQVEDYQPVRDLGCLGRAACPAQLRQELGIHRARFRLAVLFQKLRVGSEGGCAAGILLHGGGQHAAGLIGIAGGFRLTHLRRVLPGRQNRNGKQAPSRYDNRPELHRSLPDCPITLPCPRVAWTVAKA